MAEATATATSPAANGGNVDIEKIVASAVETAVQKMHAQHAEQIKGLTEQIGKLQAAQTPPEKKAEAKGDQPKPLTMEDLTKVLNDRDAANKTTSAKSAARQRVIAGKLKDVPEEFHASLPDTDNEQELNAAADKIVTRVNEVMKVRQANVGGAANDGGNPNKSPAAPAINGVGAGLSKGVAAFAQGIKLPTK